MTRILLAALLLLATAAGGAQAAEGRTLSLQVQLHETPYGFHVAPERIDAKTGDTLKLEVVNLGKTNHRLVFCATAGAGRCGSEWAADTGIIAVNASKAVEFRVIQPGSYSYYSPVGTYMESGMKGELVVTGEPVGSNESPAPGPMLPLLAAALLFLVLRRNSR